MALNPFDQTLEDLERESQAPKKNPFIDTLKEMDGDRETQIRGSLTVAQDTTPDRRAEAMRLGQRLGLPVDVVERNFDQIKKRATVADTPYSQMMRETPELATWLEEPNNAAIAHDDLEQLGALEWLFTAPQRAFAQGVNQVRFGQLKTESMFRELSRAEHDLLASYRYHMDLGGELGAGGAWWKKAVSGAGQLLPNIAGGAAMALKYGTAGALATGSIGAVGGAPGAVAGAGIGFKAGGLYGAAKFGFQLEAGLALDEYEKFTDETGQPIDTDVATAAALATGVLNAGLEAYGLTKLAQSIPGVNKLTGGATRAAVKEALRRPTVRAGLAAAMRSYGGTLTAETATEVAQRAATILSGELAKTASGQAIAHRGGADIFEDLINEGVAAIQSFGLTVLPGPALQVAQARAQAQAAQGNVDFFRDLGAGMAASKAAQRAPEAVQQLVERAVAAGPVPNLYAPVETWVTYWQSQGQDPAEVAGAVTGNPRALADAEQAGGLLKIPTSAYAVKLAPTEHNEFFASELKMAPDEMNTREALEFQEAEVARAEQEQQAAMTPTQQVEQQLRERLTAAAIPEATAGPLAQLVSAAVGKLSTDAGFDPVDVFSGYGFKVERPTSSDPAPKPAVAVAPAEGETAPSSQPYAVETLPLEAGAPAPAAQTTTVDPDAPIAAMEDIVGASIRMELEDPDIRAKAEAMRQGAARRRTEPRTDVDLAARALQTSQSEVEATDGDRTQTGDRPADNAGQRATPDLGGREPGAGDGARTQRRRLPAPADYAEEGIFQRPKRAKREDFSERLTSEVTREVVRILDELTEFTFIEKTWTFLGVADRKTGNAAGGDANIVGGAAGAPVYDDILEFSPLNKSSKSAGAAKTTTTGRPEVQDAVRKLVETGIIHNNIAEGAVRVAERRAADDYRYISRPMLPPSWGVEATPEIVDELRDAIDTALADADASFEPSEFEQSMLSLFDDAEESGPVQFETGKPATFTYIRNPEKAPDMGERFGQDVEPAGRYLQEWTGSGDGTQGGRLEGGQMAVKNPLVVEFGGGYQEANNWKRVLSTKYNGLTGAELSQAIVADGYDAIVTMETDKRGTRHSSEIVDLSPFIDTLDTGEQQPRLPGAEAVREQNIQTPEVAEAPFALTSERAAPRKGKQTELFQALPKLVAHHNLTAANLLHMEKMGGLAVPSLAITPAEATITGFGEITLLGSTALADPTTGTQVYGADVYSPRYPTVHYKIDRKNEAKLSAIFKANPEGGQPYIDLDGLEKEGARYLRQSGAVMSAFLKEQGIEVPPAVMEAERAGVRTFSDYYASRLQLERIIEDRKLEAEFEAYAEKVFASLNPTERIFRGFTDQGNRSYKPHTLENVVSILKKEIRGGESEGNLYGMGQLRAKFTPRFRSLAGIKKAQGRIVAPGAFESVKEELEKEFFGISNQLAPYYDHDPDTFRFSDTVIAVMEDAPRMGLGRALKEYSFSDVPADVQAEIGDFLQKLRTLPTEYFEAKALRSVSLEEFAGAVVPDTASPEVLALLERAGIPSAVYKKGDEADRRRVVAELAEQLGDRVLFQDRAGDKRGSIVFGPDRSVTINLFEKADLSTFLHESGHFFLELYGDLVDKLAGTPIDAITPTQRRLVADYATLLKELGVESREDIGREQHERFARMFETYLGEGRAPSLELQEIFARFRAWLLGVYRSLRALKANLTPEVRDVFDRMLATDEQIAAAEARGRFEPIFATAEAAGMSTAEFELYRQTVEDASRKAREQLDAKLFAEVRREQTRAWAEERAAIREKVEELAYQAPIYRALAAIRYGKNPDGTPLLEGMDVPPLKLSRQLIVDRYGEERLKRLPKPYVYARTGGVDPELVAERFGFSSGDELLRAIETSDPLERAIDRETDSQMIQRHGAMLLDGTVADAAQLAASSEVRDGVLRAELRALWALANKVKPFVQQARREGADALKDAQAEREYERRWFEAETKLRVAIAEGKKQAEIDALERTVSELKARTRGGAVAIRAGLPSAVVLQQTAEARIARTRVHDLTPAVFWSASRKAAAKALEHAARQEFDEAIAAKTAELLNVTLYREAEKARADAAARVERARDLGKPKSRARIGLAGTTFLEQIDGILDRYNFAKMSAKDLAKRARMRDWMEAMEAQGLPVDDLPPEVVDDLRRVDYQTIPYEELVGVTDGLQQIVHLARLKNRQLKTIAAGEFSTTRDALAASIRENNAARKHPLEFDRAEERKHSIARGYASHIKIATFARMMDGGKDGGAMWETIIRPINEAADIEQTRRTEEGRLIAALLEKHYPGREMGRLKDKVFIPAIGGSLSKEARIAAVLTRGNEDGLARLLADPTRRWNKAGVEAIAATLDSNDLAFVNAMWKHLERLWPEIAAKQERVTGLAPEKVDPAPFAVHSSDGVDVAMTGGYYPLTYDDRLNARAQRNTAVSEAKLASAAAYVSATTRRGHTKARVSNVKLSVRLDLGVAFQHVDQVLHDLTHHEMLIDVTRLIRDQKIADAIYETRGPAVYRQFTQALSAIAVGSSPESDLDKAATFMRTGAQVAGLGWNLWTGAQQPLGLFNGMERVGAKWVMRGIRRWLSDAATMQSTLAWIVDNSKMMAERSNTGTQDIMQLRQALGKSGGWFDNLVRTVTLDNLTQQQLLDSFLWHIGIMQRVADVPTWLGAYEKAMADPANEANEERAFRLADQAVIDSQGSGHIKDLADVQRGSGVAKLWLTFYSYGSTTINRAAAIADRGARTPNSIATMLGHYLLLYVAPAAATITLANALGKRDDDDPESWLGAVAAESLGATLNGIVLVRELAGALTDGTRGYAGPAGARLLQTLSSAIQQVKQGEADEAMFRAINAAAGVIFRYPAGQVQRTVDGFTALQEGRTSNPAALLFGAPPEER